MFFCNYAVKTIYEKGSQDAFGTFRGEWIG